MVCLLCTALLILLLHLALLNVYLRFTRGKYRIRRRLNGKVYVVTGASAGIGKSTALELARNGAKVYLACRNEAKTERVAKEIRRKAFNNDVHFIHCDLNDFKSVRKCAERLLELETRIDCLINNAGIMKVMGGKQTTVDGNEETMQANHFGHFLLTNLLLDHLIANKSRIVVVSSMLGMSNQNFGYSNDFDPKDLNFEKTRFGQFKVYCWSKLANILFTRELSNKIQGSGATVNCCHPGAVHTELTEKGFGSVPFQLMGVFTSIGVFKNSSQGAMTTLYLATSEELENVSGEYFADCAPAANSVQALDSKMAQELWIATEKIVEQSAS